MLKLIYTSGHVLIVNSRCYGRCYVKQLVLLCAFLKFHTHLKVNSARLFQNLFNKSSRVLNLVFSKKWNFYWTSPYFEVHTTLIITQVKNKIAYHSINWVKKLKYRRRVINKQLAKGCAIFRTRVIRQKVPLKIVGFCMETPCWTPNVKLTIGRIFSYRVSCNLTTLASNF